MNRTSISLWTQQVCACTRIFPTRTSLLYFDRFFDLDLDLGSGGTCLLDGSVFYGTGVSRIAVVVGKNAKVYVLNANNLGGYMQGPGGTDDVLQTIVTTNSVFGGSGSYPLEGGYFYFTPIGDGTYAFKFGTDANGVPSFTQAGKTAVQSAGRVGVGQPTITSYNGQPGTAIVSVFFRVEDSNANHLDLWAIL